MDAATPEQILAAINSASLLQKIINIYCAEKLKPIFGYEIEFYISSGDIKDISDTLKLNITTESGANQYEIQQGPFDDATQTAESILQIRKALTNLGADLSPKPFSHDYGSSMHIHFNILTESGKNLFESHQMLQFAASGICQFMNQTLFAILEYEQDYHRLDSNFMTPTHVCYGNHNRTVAARLPQTPPRRIEYRLCSNYSDPYRALFIILKSSLFGIKNKLNNYSQIFGNAFDPQYNLTKLPENLFQAKELFNINFFLQP